RLLGGWMVKPNHDASAVPLRRLAPRRTERQESSVATEIKLPALAPSMTEGNVARWAKQEGEAVSAGEVFAEIETDKAEVDLEPPAAGALGRIVVPAGTNGVKNDTVIGWIVQVGEVVPASGASAAAPALAASPAPGAAPASSGPASGAAAALVRPAGGRIFASPLARRLSEQAGVSLEDLRGSGPHGRIVRIDMEAAMQTARTTAPATAAATPAGGSG